MINSRRLKSLAAPVLTVVICAIIYRGPALAQVRGVYPLGMSATNSGVTPNSGFTYSNQLLIYSRDRLKGPNGEVLATGNNSVVMDMNTLAWVSRKKIFGGAKFSFLLTHASVFMSITTE